MCSIIAGIIVGNIIGIIVGFIVRIMIGSLLTDLPTDLPTNLPTSLMLVWSQEIVSETGDEVFFRLFVAPNYELVQRILMYGPEVRVISPPELVKEIKDSLTETLKKYK